MYMILLVLVINGVLLTSGVSMLHVDIIYLNSLIGVLSLGYIIYDYTKFRRSILKTREDLVRLKQVNSYALKNDSLLYEIVTTIEGLHEDQVIQYQEGQKELEDYLNRWIHEIKIPIAVATMISEQLPEGERFELNYEIERIKYYVNQALYVMKANDANKDLFVEEIALKPLIFEVIKGYKTFFMEKDILVNVDGVTSCTVKSDKQWLTYGVQQICHNAIKYSENSGVIEIKTIDLDHKTVITIKDTGIGIEDHEIPKVFSKGFVGTNGRAHKTATGMGMYLTKKMLSRVAADIYVTSKPREGSCFTIEIVKQSVM